MGIVSNPRAACSNAMTQWAAALRNRACSTWVMPERDYGWTFSGRAGTRAAVDRLKLSRRPGPLQRRVMRRIAGLAPAPSRTPDSAAASRGGHTRMSDNAARAAAVASRTRAQATSTEARQTARSAMRLGTRFVGCCTNCRSRASGQTPAATRMTARRARPPTDMPAGRRGAPTGTRRRAAES